jgi:hypothetical protein
VVTNRLALQLEQAHRQCPEHWGEGGVVTYRVALQLEQAKRQCPEELHSRDVVDPVFGEIERTQTLHFLQVLNVFKGLYAISTEIQGVQLLEVSQVFDLSSKHRCNATCQVNIDTCTPAQTGIKITHHTRFSNIPSTT